MRTVQQGDRVRVHFVKRTLRGDVDSSRGRTPLELTIGTDHRRLPGLGLALVGLGEGQRVMLVVPPEQAYGLPLANRLRRLARSRFPEGESLAVGNWVRATDRHGHRRLVRVVEARPDRVVVDTNHPWAGQAVALEVEVVLILDESPDQADPGTPATAPEAR
jgi:FKBP-type peptidyl-prolyl cis-trans isomerase 2